MVKKPTVKQGKMGFGVLLVLGGIVIGILILAGVIGTAGAASPLLALPIMMFVAGLAMLK